MTIRANACASVFRPDCGSRIADRGFVLVLSVLSASLWCNTAFAVDPPVVGRPTDFSGAIGGPFVVSLSAEPTQLTVEQPLTLTLRIVGPGNLRELPRPALGKLDSFRGFAVDELDDEYHDGPPPTRTFRYRLRPRTPDVTQIPPIRFVYFNPAIVPPSRGYQTTYAEGIALAVKPEPPSGDARLAETIAGLHRELARNPGDYQLRSALAAARDRVAYPSSDLRPAESSWPAWLTLRHAPGLALAGAAAAAIALRRWRTTRALGWLIALGGCLIAAGLPAVGTALEWRDQARNEAEPIVVISQPTTLRRGNGDAYPPRIDVPLPRGAEARRLFTRGEWIQVELANGVVGWIPGRAVTPPPGPE
jgi:hypothetical protein